MESNRKLTSNFANPVGIGCLALLTVIFYYCQLTDVAVILFLFFLLFSIAWLWNKYALSHLEIHTDTDMVCTFPGNSCALSCRVINHKFLPLMWLELLFPLADSGSIIPAEEENSKLLFHEETGEEIPAACARLSWLLWHQESSLDIPLKAECRGITTFATVTAASGDGFGLGAKERSFPLDSPSLFVVYPAILPVQISGLTQSLSDTEAGRGGYLEDVTLLKMSRLYEPGDSVKRINWRQMARQNTVVTNVYETIFPKMMTFLLDLSSFRTCREEKNTMNSADILIWSPLKDELELMLSITASLILRLSDSGICCGLAVPGTAEGKDTLLYPGRSGSSAYDLLYALAAVSYHTEEVQLPWDRLEKNPALLGTVCVVTHSYGSMTLAHPMLADMHRTVIICHSHCDKENFSPFRLIHKEDLTA